MPLQIYSVGLVFLTLAQACATPSAKERVLLAGSAAPARQAVPHCAINQLGPTRDAFLHEMLFAAESPNTTTFDAYTAGSYSVRKLDVLSNVQAYAARCQLQLDAVVVVGPVGTLWTYQVLTVLHEGSAKRIHALSMPHARITSKSTGVGSPDEVTGMLAGLHATGLLRPGMPPELSVEPSPEAFAADATYPLMLALYGTSTPRYFHAQFDPASQEAPVRTLRQQIAALQALAKTKTYGM